MPRTGDGLRRGRLQSEAFEDSRLAEKDAARGQANLVDDKAQAQHVPGAIERRALEFLDGGIAALGPGLALRVPDDGPALAGIAVMSPKMLPAQCRFVVPRPLTRFHGLDM